MKAAIYYRSLLIASMIAFGASLSLPAIVLKGQPSDVIQGFDLLLLGWLAFFQGSIAWFANLFYLMALLLVVAKHDRWAILLSGVGLLLATTFLWNAETLSFSLYAPHDIGSPTWGYYCWLTSLLLLFIHTVRSAKQVNASKNDA